MDTLIDWQDFSRCGWTRSECLQWEFSKDGVDLSLLEPDMRGLAEIEMQARQGRSLTRRSIRFPLPVSREKYNEAIAMLESWSGASLPELRWVVGSASRNPIGR